MAILLVITALSVLCSSISAQIVYGGGNPNFQQFGGSQYGTQAGYSQTQQPAQSFGNFGGYGAAQQAYTTPAARQYPSYSTQYSVPDLKTPQYSTPSAGQAAGYSLGSFTNSIAHSGASAAQAAGAQYAVPQVPQYTPQAPQYQAPQYQAPAYQAPAYQAPSYSAPATYSAPAYQQSQPAQQQSAPVTVDFQTTGFLIPQLNAGGSQSQVASPQAQALTGATSFQSPYVSRQAPPSYQNTFASYPQAPAAPAYQYQAPAAPTYQYQTPSEPQYQAPSAPQYQAPRQASPAPAPQVSYTYGSQFDKNSPTTTPKPIVYAPAPVHYVSIGEKLEGDYKFGYDTGKGDLGQSFREEVRLPDGTVKGSYGYVDESGKMRTVNYVAGREGFKVLSDEEFKNYKPSPAAPAQGSTTKAQASAPAPQQYIEPATSRPSAQQLTQQAPVQNARRRRVRVRVRRQAEDYDENGDPAAPKFGARLSKSQAVATTTQSRRPPPPVVVRQRAVVKTRTTTPAPLESPPQRTVVVRRRQGRRRKTTTVAPTVDEPAQQPQVRLFEPPVAVPTPPTTITLPPTPPKTTIFAEPGLNPYRSFAPLPPQVQKFPPLSPYLTPVSQQNENDLSSKLYEQSPNVNPLLQNIAQQNDFENALQNAELTQPRRLAEQAPKVKVRVSKRPNSQNTFNPNNAQEFQVNEPRQLTEVAVQQPRPVSVQPFRQHQPIFGQQPVVTINQPRRLPEDEPSAEVITASKPEILLQYEDVTRRPQTTYRPRSSLRKTPKPKTTKQKTISKTTSSKRIITTTIPPPPQYAVPVRQFQEEQYNTPPPRYQTTVRSSLPPQQILTESYYVTTPAPRLVAPQSPALPQSFQKAPITTQLSPDYSLSTQPEQPQNNIQQTYVTPPPSLPPSLVYSPQLAPQYLPNNQFQDFTSRPTPPVAPTARPTPASYLQTASPTAPTSRPPINPSTIVSSNGINPFAPNFAPYGAYDANQPPYNPFAVYDQLSRSVTTDASKLAVNAPPAKSIEPNSINVPSRNDGSTVSSQEITDKRQDQNRGNSISSRYQDNTPTTSPSLPQEPITARPLTNEAAAYINYINSLRSGTPITQLTRPTESPIANGLSSYPDYLSSLQNQPPRSVSSSQAGPDLKQRPTADQLYSYSDIAAVRPQVNLGQSSSYSLGPQSYSPAQTDRQPQQFSQLIQQPRSSPQSEAITQTPTGLPQSYVTEAQPVVQQRPVYQQQPGPPSRPISTPYQPSPYVAYPAGGRGPADSYGAFGSPAAYDYDYGTPYGPYASSPYAAPFQGSYPPTQGGYRQQRSLPSPSQESQARGSSVADRVHLNYNIGAPRNSKKAS